MMLMVYVRVHPTMLPIHHPLANVNDVYNAIFVTGDAVGDTMFLGRGAGACQPPALFAEIL